MDSFDTSKLLLVHNKFIQRVVGQKSTSRVFETLVREAIDTAFDGFIHNKTMRGETEKRIDHRLLIGNTILAIETDEFAHQYYGETKENTRYREFLTKTSHKFVFIRFNCDANRESDNAKTDFKHKLRVLMHTITYQMSRIQHGQNIQQLEIFTLFYYSWDILINAGVLIDHLIKQQTPILTHKTCICGAVGKLLCIKKKIQA